MMDGVQLKEIRKRRSESQAEFAEALNQVVPGRNYCNVRVSKWENGGEPVPQLVALAAQRLAEGGGVRGECIIIALANQKGGVGKTTTTVNLGYALAQAGKRVLLIDLDPQANATVHLGIDPFAIDTAKRSIYHALIEGVPLADTVVTAEAGQPLFLAPSSLTLAAAEAELITEPGGAAVLREKLEDIAADYDFILIDSPPHLGMLTTNALTAAHFVLIPTQTEILSAMGIPMLLQTVEKIRRRNNRALRILGLLPTMYKQRHSQDRASFDELMTAYGKQTKVFTPIPEATAYPQSVGEGRPALATARGAAVDAYWELAQHVLALQAAEAAHV